MKAVELLPILLILFSIIHHGGSIYKGRLADIDRFPYMASFQHLKRGLICGAAIIHEKYVLTAGHCVYELNEMNHIVVYGSVWLKDLEREVVAVEKFHPHPEFSPEVYAKNDTSDSGKCGVPLLERLPANDIALIEVTEPFANKLITVSQRQMEVSELKVAKIGLADMSADSCKHCSLAGWGASSPEYSAPTSELLQYMSTIIHYEDDCNREDCPFGEKIFCAQNFPSLSSPRQGDSGGPLICNGVVIGVLSFISDRLGAPAYYSDVSQYREFIDPFITTE